MSQARSSKERYLDYGLIFLASLLQVMAFALLLATLVSPVPSYGSHSGLASFSSGETTVHIGPLGACTKLPDATPICTVASVSPQFNASYAMANVPTALLQLLPADLPDLPSLLLFVVLASALTTLISNIAVLPRCFTSRMTGSKLALYSPHLLKGAVVGSGIALIFGVTVASCLRIYFGDTVEDFNTLAKAMALPWEAALSNRGFPQLWAAIVFIGISLLGQVGLVLSAPVPQLKLGSFQWA